MERAPVPVSVTVCGPDPSSAVMSQASERAPSGSGANRTVWASDAPASTVVPSTREVVAVKPVPLAGGFDFVIVSALPPVLVNLKVAAALEPATTGPNAIVDGVISRRPGVPALPDTGTSTIPALVATSSSPVNNPTAVGANVAVTVRPSPGPITDPTAGGFVTVYGGPGRVAPVIVSEAAPVFINTAVPRAGGPFTATPPKLRAGGVAASWAAADCPVPVSPIGTDPRRSPR